MKRSVLYFCLAFILARGGLRGQTGSAGGCDVPAFGGARIYATANDAQSIATGDFNHDGFPDLAVSNLGGNNVSVLLGNGDGTFQPAVNYPTGANSGQVVVADFNGDGKPDLAVAVSGSVLILLGNGDGTFKAAISTSSASSQMAVGDFNGDGKPDLVVTSYPITVLLGKGDGTFQAPISAAQGAGLAIAQAIVVGDFNGDGKLDALAADLLGGVDVMLGDGKGNLAAPVNFSAGPSAPSMVAVGDFNGDHKLDLVALSNIGGSMTILLGNGDGTFTAGATYNSVGMQPTFVVVADMNGDGQLDFAATSLTGQEGGQGTISVYAGNGDGTFQPPVSYNPTAQVNWALAVADFNADGLPDMAFASIVNNTPTQAGVMLGNPNGTFQSPANYALGGIPQSVALADLNGDSVPDMVVVSGGLTSYVSVLLGNGDGTFRAPVKYPTAFGATSVAVGDLNGDGKPDLVVANGSAGNLLVFLGNGDGTFQNPLSSGSVFLASVVVIGDFNGDGKQDVIVLNSSGYVTLLGKGDGTFSSPILNNVGLQTGGMALVAADLNGDGKLDLVMTTAVVANATATTGIGVLLGKGDGTFQTPVTYMIGSNAQSISVADFNGDGKPDLAVADLGASAIANQLGQNPGGAIAVMLGNGDGTFQAEVRYPSPKGPTTVAAGDFNGDGKADLAILSTDLVNVETIATLMLGNGDGTFRNAVNYGAGADSTALAVSDLNGDGKPDLAIADQAGIALVMMNTYTQGSASACTQVQPLGK